MMMMMMMMMIANFEARYRVVAIQYSVKHQGAYLQSSQGSENSKMRQQIEQSVELLAAAISWCLATSGVRGRFIA